MVGDPAGAGESIRLWTPTVEAPKGKGGHGQGTEKRIFSISHFFPLAGAKEKLQKVHHSESFLDPCGCLLNGK